MEIEELVFNPENMGSIAEYYDLKKLIFKISNRFESLSSKNKINITENTIYSFNLEYH